MRQWRAVDLLSRLSLGMFAEHAQVGLHGPTLLSFRNTASGIRERTQNYLKGLPPTSTGRFQGRGPRRETGCKGEEPRLNIGKYLSLPEAEKKQLRYREIVIVEQIWSKAAKPTVVVRL